MDIHEAAAKLSEHFNEPDVFIVKISKDYASIVVDVNFIYRVEDVDKLGGTWEGYPVTIGRRSCW